MLSKRSELKDKYEPLNLCCALAAAYAKCNCCVHSLCKPCFEASHIKMGAMYCGSQQMKWGSMVAADLSYNILVRHR